MKPNYEKTLLPKRFDVRSVYTIHYFKYGKEFSFPEEQHDFWELVYVDGGTAQLTSGEKQLSLKQGQAILHAPNTSHSVRTDQSFANAAIISFECSARATYQLTDRILTLDEAQKQLLASIVKEGSAVFQDKLNDPHLLKMTKRHNAPFGGEQLIKSYIETLLILLYRTATKKEHVEDKDATHKADEISYKIIKILNDNVYANVTLEDISKELYFSKTYVKNVFKKCTGTSIIQYYINLKIEEAKKLISQNKYSFTEISYMLGLSSVHYFSRLFKQRTEMSPSEYSKSIKVDNLIS